MHVHLLAISCILPPFVCNCAGSIKPSVYSFSGDFDQVEVDKFVEESLKMSRFKHAHVMGLIGVCLDAASAPYIIMPYMANGSLLKYLKKERKNIVLSEEADEDEVMYTLFYQALQEQTTKRC